MYVLLIHATCHPIIYPFCKVITKENKYMNPLNQFIYHLNRTGELIYLKQYIIYLILPITLNKILTHVT